MSGKRDLSGYNYAAISSLVLTADRSALPRRDKEPDGAPTSLAGRIDPREMGSRVKREKPEALEKKREKGKKGKGKETEGKDKDKDGDENMDKAEGEERAPKRRAAEASGFGYTDILEATQDVEGLTYRPRTAETREVYELI